MLRTLIACVATAALTVAVVSADGQAGSSVVHLHVGQTLKVDGYSFNCSSTRRTPNFGCAYGQVGGPAQTPIWTVTPGSRLINIQSVARPRVVRAGGYYDTTIAR